MKKSCVFETSILTDVTLVSWIVEESLSFLIQRITLTEEQIFDIKVILNELIVNAIIHGNRKDKNKKIHIKVGIYNGTQIYIIIEDEGHGAYYGPKCNEGLVETLSLNIDDLNESGRGLQIVSCLCNTIKTNKKGNKIIVLKKI